MQKILVPTDFSIHAENALDLARQIAEKANAEIMLMHVIEFVVPSVVGPMSPSNVEFLSATVSREMISQVNKKLQEISEKPDLAAIKLTTKTEVGNPYRSVANEISGNDVDLVVMGSKGASGIEETLIGSNAEKVVRKTQGPVIIVKSRTQLSRIKKVVLATNLKEEQDYMIEKLKSFLKLVDSELHLISINVMDDKPMDDQIRHKMETFIGKNGLENCHCHYRNDLLEEEGIIKFAEEIDADMIAMGTHGRTGFAHLIHGSVTENLVNHAKRPVWTCHLKD